MLTRHYFKKTYLFILLLIVGFSAINIPVALAQPAPTEGISLQISPLPIELTTKPGNSVSADLRVRNAGSQDEKLQVRILKVSADDNGNVHLTQPSANDTWVNWIHFSKTTFDAPPGAWQTIGMSVEVPKDAAFGYYWAVEYLRANTEGPQPGKAVARGAVATFILLNADAPGANRQAQVASFSADRKSYEFLPATFTVKLRNTGNVHVAPSGNIFILHGKKQVGSININSAQGNILPDSSRFFSAAWSDGFPVYVGKTNADGSTVVNKAGKPVKSLHWDFSKANHLRFGHYTAHLVMVYDDGNRDVPLEAYVSFWVIPWRLVIYAILIVVGPALLVYLIMRRRFNRRLAKERKKSSHAN
jgi:hypothetical protein